MNIKKIGQKLLSKFGLRITRIPRFINPIAPFDLLELAIENEIIKKSNTFYFIHIGLNNYHTSLSLASVVRKFRLKGCIIDYFDQPHNKRESTLFDQSQLDFLEIKRDNNCPPTPAGIIAILPKKPISVLSLGGTSINCSHIEAIFSSGLYPPIINLDRTEIISEIIYSFKMTLLDNRYRFIDVGTDTICLRLTRD